MALQTFFSLFPSFSMFLFFAQNLVLNAFQESNGTRYSLFSIFAQVRHFTSLRKICGIFFKLWTFFSSKLLSQHPCDDDFFNTYISKSIYSHG